MAAWHYCAPSCAIALRSPASERSSDLKRHSPAADIHPHCRAHVSLLGAPAQGSEVAAPTAPSLVARRRESDLELPVVLSHHLVTRKQPRTQTTRAACPCRHVLPRHTGIASAPLLSACARAREWGVRTFKLPVSLIFIVPFPFFSSSSESLVRPEKNPWHCDGGR